MPQTTKKPWTPVKAPVVVPVYCGSCFLFDSHAVRTNFEGKPVTCSKLGIGIVANSKPCKEFTVNPYTESLRKTATNGNVKRLLNEITPDAFGPLAALLTHEVETRASGYRFGQLVYVNVRYRGASDQGHATDFLANYYRGEVVMVKDGIAYVSHRRVRIAIAVGALLTRDQWNQRRAYLLDNNRIVDRDNPHSWSRTDVKALRDPSYRPAWLDSAIEAYLSRPVDDMTPIAPKKRGRGRPKGTKKQDA